MLQLFWLFLILTVSLQGEIEKVTIKWNPVVCQGYCIPNLIGALRASAPVAEFVVNPQEGLVNIRWKPRFLFNYETVRQAIVGSTGIPILDIRVQVRGTILATNTGVILQSLGDNTQFILLSPVQQNLTANVPQNSLFNRVLSPELTQQFQEGARDSAVVTVAGRLLRPQMGLYLVVEQAVFNRLGQNAIPGPR